jgi:Na+/phosphate symporter
MGNAVLNAIFNISTAILFAPFLLLFTRLIKKTIPDRTNNMLQLAIDNMSQEQEDFAESIVTPAQLSALRDDTQQMIRYTINYNCYIRGYDYKQIVSKKLADKPLLFSNNRHKKDYILNKDRADRILKFLNNIKQYNLSQDELNQTDHLQETIIACIRSMKAIKNIRHNIQSLRHSNDSIRKELYESLLKDNMHLYRELVRIVEPNGESYHLE